MSRLDEWNRFGSHVEGARSLDTLKDRLGTWNRQGSDMMSAN